MASYNPNNEGNFQYLNTGSKENKGLFSRILRDLSNHGMKYDDMIMRNQVAFGMNEDPNANYGSMYDFFSSKAVAAILDKKSIPYLDRAYADKKRILREYSIKDEIKEFVTIVCDDAIIYSDDKFCDLKPISNDYPQDVKDKYIESFQKIYYNFGFSDSISAWHLMKDFLIDGYLAMEIVWDDQKKNIINFNRLHPETVVPSYEPSIGNIWIQYPDDPKNRTILLDSQIIFISYTSQNDYSETSYVEGLIKPYNQLKILEQSKIMFNIINATLYQKFTIPTKGLGRTRAEEQIGKLIQNYSEQVEWDDTTGILRINGSKNPHYNKQFWFPDGDAGTPEMEIVSPEGHDLNEDIMLKWFFNVLKRASKIPSVRLEDEGGGNIFSDASEITHEEAKFSNFIQRLRANFKELILKPLKLQMLVEFPEYKDDERFLNQLNIDFLSNQLFEEYKKLGNFKKKAEIVQELSSLQRSDERPYFHMEYLIDKVMQLSPEEKEENEKYWLKEKNGGVPSDEEIEGDDDFGGEDDFGGGDDFGGEDDFGGGDETGGDEGAEEGDEGAEEETDF